MLKGVCSHPLSSPFFGKAFLIPELPDPGEVHARLTELHEGLGQRAVFLHRISLSRSNRLVQLERAK